MSTRLSSVKGVAGTMMMPLRDCMEEGESRRQAVDSGRLTLVGERMKEPEFWKYAGSRMHWGWSRFHQSGGSVVQLLLFQVLADKIERLAMAGLDEPRIGVHISMLAAFDANEA